MLELRHDSLADLFTLLPVYRLVPRQRRQDRYPSPFRALIQRYHEFR